MSGYPSNRYPYQRNDSFSSHRLRYSDHSQVRRPPVPMHFQDGRISGNAPHYNITGPFGIAPKIRENLHEKTLPRPPFPAERSWTHHQGRERAMNHDKYHHGTRFLQPSNANQNQTEIRNEGSNENFNTLMPPMPPWANASTFQGIRPPNIPLPPPNILPNTVPSCSQWGQQLGPQSIRNHTPWTGTMSPTGTYANQQREKEKDNQDTSDRLFVEEWLSKRNIHKVSDGNKEKVVKIYELQQDLHNYFKCIDELKTCKDVLMQFINTDDANWQEIVLKTNSIKEILENFQSKLFHSEYMKEAINQIKKRRIKRERQKNGRRLKAKLKEEKQKSIILAHQRIDAWRHEIVSEINAKKMVDSLKSEAGQSLAEVRKKIVDCRRYLEKIDSAKELRGIRRQTALQRGIFIFGDQDEQFEKRVENMKSLLKQRLDVYDSEERTLMVMLEEEKEQLQREDDSKRKKLMEKEHLRLFGYDPLVECRRYWLQAEVNPISLVQIRRLWDVYLVPPTMMGADHIPDGWVTPEPFKNVAWNKYLKKKT